ncbi:putative 1-phosphatidylinositol 3-phosphate 5-kinase, partial [Homalodisca vitripennis]|uniref:putative 1-phosphatidylinositol 3-phosphate 5-kinase n=1 Tax=Homalodisca vitripennis TaxID=197043 RepID=UPI001EEA0D97
GAGTDCQLALSVPAQSLRADNGERQTFLALSGAFQQHLGVLVKQLLNSEGVAQSWADTVLPLAQQVVATVRPDPRSDTDDMDIRQYVQLKKVSGGSRSDSCIVGGVVCSKNLAHRAMPAKLANPRILLLSCAIVYQRIEGRLMSLEPVMMQEQEYLRHTVARIAAMAPDLVLVQRNVSRLAQENLLRLGISLVLNVKPSVLDRVARMTGADIVKSIDAQVGRPQLGTCTSFYVQSFTTDTGATKTLMFLEGCMSPHLGCTVLLRGASTAELAKLKRVTGWLIYALYNWRLEFSFLMDEFAEPPTLGDDNFFQDDDHSPKKEKLLTSSPLNDNFINSQSMQQLRNSGGSRSPSVKRVKSADKENRESDESLSDRTKLSGKEKSISDERRMNVESVSDFSDPLHLYMNLDDDVFKKSNNGQSLSVSEPAKSNRFRKALDDTLLSVSPFLKFSVPYLETENGRNCLLRRYFPKQVYWTAQLQDKTVTRPTPAAPEMSNKDALLKLNGIKLGPVHPFITAKLTEPANSHNVQTMLAFYRACGGRLPLPPLHKPLVPPTPTPATAAPTPAPPTDALDPAKHQRLAVLFCSYSHESHNAPSFCVNPWVVHMDYYGRNDIPLGAFLERYCFRSSYTCQSDRCDTPMLKHVRRFVHEGGAVQISLREIEGAPHTDDDSILMWTYCPACNQQVSQVMRMSPDTWSFSFAKFLELHFHAGQYTVRGSDCTHSIHQACRQFFGHNNMVAYFQYEKISVWEISLPPLLLVTQPTTQAAHQDAILEEVKRWALNGYEVFSAILNRLCTLASNGEAGAMVMKQQLQKEQTMFKGRVEEIQMRLTSPTHMCQPPSQGQTDSVWQLEDSLVLLKRSIAEAVAEWNVRLSEAETAHSARKREEKNKKSGQDIKTNLSTSAGLSEIIDGQPLAQAYDVGETAASRRSLPSQSSLQSATDVVDDVLATTEDTIFTVDGCDVDVLDSPAAAVVKPTEDSAPVMAPESTVPTSSSSELISESEEVHEHTSMEQDIQPDEDVDVNPNRDSHNAKHPHQLTDRVSVKQILSQLLPKDTPANPLQCPMSPQEHHTLPLGAAVPVVVYEREPSFHHFLCPQLPRLPDRTGGLEGQADLCQ